MPDVDPPIITLLSPEAGSVGNDKAVPIQFTVTDASDLALVKCWVRGDVAYDGVKFSDGWEGSTVEVIPNGYLYTLVPSITQYGRIDEATRIRIFAVDVEDNEANGTWSFYYTANVIMSTYRFIIGSIRDLDEA